jgi:hypothetical protein|tara:strand:- start:357 stop:470 length:114 start_codon:yes stop_codon:yes gene_type:complete
MKISKEKMKMKQTSLAREASGRLQLESLAEKLTGGSE